MATKCGVCEDRRAKGWEARVLVPVTEGPDGYRFCPVCDGPALRLALARTETTDDEPAA